MTVRWSILEKERKLRRVLELNVLRGLEYQVPASGNHIKMEVELSFVGSKNMQQKNLIDNQVNC